MISHHSGHDDDSGGQVELRWPSNFSMECFFGGMVPSFPTLFPRGNCLQEVICDEDLNCWGRGVSEEFLEGCFWQIVPLGSVEIRKEIILILQENLRISQSQSFFQNLIYYPIHTGMAGIWRICGRMRIGDFWDWEVTGWCFCIYYLKFKLHHKQNIN